MDEQQARRPVRVVNTIYFLLLLVWMPIEGNLLIVTIFGVATAAWLSFHLISTLSHRKIGDGSSPFLVGGGVGLLNGLLLPLIILILMSLKTGLHAHGPEFTR